MKLSGTARLSATPQQVWVALNDQAVLARTIPGCLTFNEVAADEYAMTVSAGVASIKGTYLGHVRLTDKQEPTSYVLHASGSGGPGTVSAQCLVRLSTDGDGTTVSYDADAVIGGVIAGVGQRVISAVAKKMAGQFFGQVDAELRGERRAAALVPAAPEAGGVPVVRSVPSGVLGGSVSQPSLDNRSLLAGGVVGALIALVGVLVGSRLGRGR